MINEVVPIEGGFGSLRDIKLTRGYLLVVTTTHDTMTGDPIISRMTKIACCQAVRALRSTVAKPVPVAALTQIKRESMNLTWNFPLDAQRMIDQKSGNRTLRWRKRAIRVKLLLDLTVSVHLQS